MGNDRRVIYGCSGAEGADDWGHSRWPSGLARRYWRRGDLPLLAGGRLHLRHSAAGRRCAVAGLTSPVVHPPGTGMTIIAKPRRSAAMFREIKQGRCADDAPRSEEHTSELQSLMRTSYAVFCLK